jgi:hypothetical protein
MKQHHRHRGAEVRLVTALRLVAALRKQARSLHAEGPQVLMAAVVATLQSTVMSLMGVTCI